MDTIGLTQRSIDSSVFKGELFFTAQQFYPPDLLEAWKNALQEKTFQPVEWKYGERNLAEFYTTGNIILIEDEIDGALNIQAFTEKFNSRKPH